MHERALGGAAHPERERRTHLASTPLGWVLALEPASVLPGVYAAGALAALLGGTLAGMGVGVPMPFRWVPFPGPGDPR